MRAPASGHQRRAGIAEVDGGMRSVVVDKLASVTQACGLAHEVRIAADIPAEEGVVVIVEVLNNKTSYNTLELTSGRMAKVGKGDVVAGALGHRRALFGYSGHVPERVQPGDIIQMLNIGGEETLTSAGSIPDEAWILTRDAFAHPRTPERHTLSFRQGRPVALDGGTATGGVAIIESLEALAAPFGIGRGIHLGDTIIGTKGRVAFEAPAAEVLLCAHRELEKLVLTGRQQRIKELVSQPYGDLVHEGQLLDPVCRDIEALLLCSQQRVTGDVHLVLQPANVFVAGVESPWSLMAASKGVYGEAAGEWSARDALGFSRIAALPGVFHARAGERSGARDKDG